MSAEDRGTTRTIATGVPEHAIEDHAVRSNRWRSIGWGLFLASSWTWCIGAFLPILLLRDFGWPGFLVFAIPNVLGATAVGFVWTRERSRAFAARRRALLGWFSAATLAYQAFFIVWIAPLVVDAALGTPMGEGMRWLAWLVAATIFAAIASGGRGSDRAWISLGVVATLGSYALWAVHGVGAWHTVDGGSAPSIDLWLLAPAIWLGFIVCPHLDLTFHRVVERDATRLPWMVFAPAFTALLLFAAGAFSGWSSTDGSQEALTGAAVDASTIAPIGEGGALVALSGAFVAFWFIQISFTGAAHARELRASPMHGAAWLAPLSIAIGAIAGAPPLGGEAVYLRILGLYGAVFPIIAVMLWRGWGWKAIVPLLVIAVPSFELGFLGPHGIGHGRWSAAPLLPIGLLLGLMAIPRRIEATMSVAAASTVR